MGLRKYILHVHVMISINSLNIYSTKWLCKNICYFLPSNQNLFQAMERVWLTANWSKWING